MSYLILHMVYIQLNLDEKENKKILIFKVNNNLKTKQEAIKLMIKEAK